MMNIQSCAAPSYLVRNLVLEAVVEDYRLTLRPTPGFPAHRDRQPGRYHQADVDCESVVAGAAG